MNLTARVYLCVFNLLRLSLLETWDIAQCIRRSCRTRQTAFALPHPIAHGCCTVPASLYSLPDQIRSLLPADETRQPNCVHFTYPSPIISYIRQPPLLMHLQASPRAMYVAPGSSAGDAISFPAALSLSFVLTGTSVIMICGCFQPTERRALQFVICGLSFISSEILLVVVSSKAYGMHCPPRPSDSS